MEKKSKQGGHDSYASRIDFNPKNIKRVYEGHYMLIKELASIRGDYFECIETFYHIFYLIDWILHFYHLSMTYLQNLPSPYGYG